MKVLLAIWLWLLCAGDVYAWGFFAHRKINEHAVYAVPEPLFGFYKLHMDYLVKHATDADNRRYVNTQEACRHYLDGDRYERRAPFDTLPHYYGQAKAKYTEDTLLAHGIVPWHIQLVLLRLTDAFKEKHTENILKLSADLGHYVGDLHVPLHASSNYNGQKTGQHGIHALWESRLPELYYESFDLLTGQAVYTTDYANLIWTAFGESFTLADSVLSSEKRLSVTFQDNRKYGWEVKGQNPVRVYSTAFCQAYYNALGTMVQDRMKASIRMLSMFWYSCWINAGQPVLNVEPAPAAPDEQAPPQPKGSMLGREEE